MHQVERRYGRLAYDLFRIHQYHFKELVNPKNKEHEARLNWIVERASAGICFIVESRSLSSQKEGNRDE